MRWYEAVGAFVVAVILIYGVRLVGTLQQPRGAWGDTLTMARELFEAYRRRRRAAG